MAKKQAKTKKAIIFSCIDLCAKSYKFVVVCDESDVNTQINEALHLSTEIVGYEVCNVYKTIA